MAIPGSNKTPFAKQRLLAVIGLLYKLSKILDVSDHSTLFLINETDVATCLVLCAVNLFISTPPSFKVNFIHLLID